MSQSKAKGIYISSDLFHCIHDELKTEFSKHYGVDLTGLTVFQLYGFSNYDDKEPNLKSYIMKRTKNIINGKYLYNKVRQTALGEKKKIQIRRDYFLILINAIGYNDYTDYINNSKFIPISIRNQEKKEAEIFPQKTKNEYYIGYYVEDRTYFVRSKFTIFEGQRAEWDILYWEERDKPSYYSYSGKCVTNAESSLSFYFPKENSNIKKECFVNLFYGNLMRIKPILLGAYCGFDRNSNPVVGKIIFERVEDKAEQERRILKTGINPAFYQYSYAERLPVGGILPHSSTDLNPTHNFDSIVAFLKGDYFGFFLNENGFFTPITFRLLNELGDIVFQINTKNHKGIARVSNQENFITAELDSKNCNFSLQVNPLEEDLFKGYLLYNLGSNILCGPVLLWKNNFELVAAIRGEHIFSINRQRLPTDIAEKFDEHLSNNQFSSLASYAEKQRLPKSLYGSYTMVIGWSCGKNENYSLQLAEDFVLESTTDKYYGKAIFMNGNLSLSITHHYDIPITGLVLVFVGNVPRHHIQNQEGTFSCLNEQNKPASGLVTLTAT